MQIASAAPLSLLLSPAGATIGGVELAGIDLVGLGIVGVLVILGIARGLWWQLIRLAGIVASVAIARVYGGRGADWILSHWPEFEPRLAHGIAWMGLFLSALAVAALFGMLGHRLLEAMQLGLANRLAGGILGAATGLLVHVALVMGLCQLAPKTFVEHRVAGTYSERLYRGASERWQGLLDPVAAAEVQRLLGTPPPAPASKAAPDAAAPGDVR